jgi:uncharacterized protein YyaL (SSP411 family)
MAAVLRRQFVPNKAVLFRPAGEKSPAIARLAGFTGNLGTRDGKATACVCRNCRCQLPVTEAEEMPALLNASE